MSFIQPRKLLKNTILGQDAIERHCMGLSICFAISVTKNKDIVDKEWKLYYGCEKIPKQEDGHLCGLWTMLFALGIVRNYDIRMIETKK